MGTKSPHHLHIHLAGPAEDHPTIEKPDIADLTDVTIGAPDSGVPLCDLIPPRV